MAADFIWGLWSACQKLSAHSLPGQPGRAWQITRYCPLWYTFPGSFPILYFPSTLMLLVANLANTKWCITPCKMTETLAHGYSSDSTQQELSNKYQKGFDGPLTFEENSLSFGKVNLIPVLFFTLIECKAYVERKYHSSLINLVLIFPNG